MKIRTQFNENYTGTVGEINSLPSKTVPDQSLTIQMLMLNHTRGIESNATELQGEYFDDIEIPVIQDITDLHENRLNLEQQFKNLQDEIERHTASNTDGNTSDNPDTGEQQKGEGSTEPPEKQ